MKKTTVILLTVLLVYSLHSQTKRAQFFDGLINAHDIPGLSIVLIEDGKVVYNSGHGVKSNDTKVPVDTRTIFSAASLSKPVFAYAVMKLVESGVFDLDRPLYQYLEFKDLAHDERYKRITARMVLSHSSGLPNWRNGKLALQFDPGKQYSYSGEGFVYLGKVIAHLQQKEIGQVIEELVFQPLEMSNSSFSWQDRFEANFAPPHDFMGYPIPKRKRRSSNVAASLQTTAEDYSKLILALLYDIERKKPTTIDMQSAQVAVPAWDNLHWGLGWGIQKTKKGKALWQWGDNGTYKAFAITNLTTRKGIVFLTNSENGLRIVPELIRHEWDEGCPAFDMIDYSTKDQPYQALLRKIVKNGYDDAIVAYLDQSQAHHDTNLIRQHQMRRIGYRLLREGRFEDAKKAYRSNVVAYPFYNSYLQYADCCLKSGDFDEAKTYYLKASALQPDNQRIITRLSQLDPSTTQANVTFKLRQTNYMYSRLITIAGDFNNWNPMIHPFVKQNGEWVCRLELKPGRYHYKFVIDGVWTLDPENPNAELDDNENFNSILIVK